MAEVELSEHLEPRWPKDFRARQMSVTDGTQYVRVGGQGPAVSCSTASATLETCGFRLRRNPSRITPS